MNQAIEFSKEDLSKIERQVKREFDESRTSLNLVKENFRKRESLITSLDKTDDKFTLNSVDGVIKGLLALYYLDELQVVAVGQNPYVYETGDERTNLFKSDYYAMDKEITDFNVQKNRLSYGVSGYYFYGRDSDGCTPLTDVIDPLAMRPDPYGHTKPNNFNRCTFDRTMSVYDVKNNESFDEKARMEARAILSEEAQLDEQARTRHRLVNRNGESIDRVTIAYHFTYYEGECILHVSMFGLTLQCIKIDPINFIRKQKGNHFGRVKRPRSMNYFDPDNTPFGKNVFDYAENPQKLKSLIMNLIKIKAVKQAMGGDYFIDSTVYSASKSILDKPSVSSRIIPVKGFSQVGIDKAVSRFPEEQLQGDVYNFVNLLDNELNDSVGLSKQMRGVDDGRAKSATESANLQRNANVNLLLANKINARGEKQYYSLMYVWYLYYFDKSSKKIISVNDSTTSINSYIERKDLMDFVAPNIHIYNKSVVLERQERIKQAFEMIYAMDIQDPAIPEIGKKYLRRYRKKLLLGSSKAELDMIHPPSPEEMKAKRDIMLLNRNQLVKVRDLTEDHITFIVLYKYAMPTPARDAAIEMRTQAYIKSGQVAQMRAQGQEQGGGMQGAITNQVVANSLQSQPTQATK